MEHGMPILKLLKRLLITWPARQRQRRQLAELSDEILNDLGIDQDAARKEANKAFWR
jgi:uncharacterized protein YjiS (DUF1127 family)